QVALGVGSVLLAAEVARHLFGSRVAVYTAALVAVFPSLVYYTAEAHLETLFNFLVLAAVLVIVSGPWRDVSRRRLLVFGFVLGLSALVRPFSLLVLPGLCLVWLLSGTRLRAALARTAWATLAVVVVVRPWLVRNVVVALGLLGLPALLRRRHPKRLLVAVVMVGLGALPFILFGDPRYHLPVLPFLAISAAAALGARHRPGRGASPRTEPTSPAEAM